MGCGKTTIGRVLAASLGWEFFDLDQIIEQKLRQSIPETFQLSGEGEFRKRERESLQLLTRDPAVIATGGGCFIYNRDWMLQHGTVIYIEVPFAALVNRIGADAGRPLWRNAEHLYQEREAEYRRAHLTVDGTLTAGEVASEIVRRIRTQTAAEKKIPVD